MITVSNQVFKHLYCGHIINLSISIAKVLKTAQISFESKHSVELLFISRKHGKVDFSHAMSPTSVLLSGAGSIHQFRLIQLAAMTVVLAFLTKLERL